MVLLILLMAWLSADAADSRINSTTSSTQETSSLNRGSQQAVSFDSLGNLVIVWTSTGQDHPSDEGVYARRIAFDGTALTGEISVNSTTTGNQNQASVASDDAGNFVVTWTSDGQDGSGTGVHVRRFAADGTALTGEIAVNTTTNGAQANPVIALDRRSGSFVVAWQGQGSGDSAGIFFRRFAADGTALDGVEQPANRTDAGTEQNPSVAISASGAFVIAFEVNSDIYFQRFDSSGAAQGSRTQVDELLVAASLPVVAMDVSGNFTCLYRVDNVLGLLAGVWGGGFASDGTKRYATFQVAAGDATSPSVAMASTGEFVVTYEMTSSGTIDTFVRRYDSDYTALGAAATANQYTSGSQSMASAAVRHIQNYAVVWSGKSSGDTRAVSVRIFGVQPVATSQSVTTLENTPRLITLTGSDADGDTIAFTIIDRPAYGSIDGFNRNTGILTYTPTNGFTGTDYFTFVAEDGVSNSALAVVRIAVAVVAPVIATVPLTQSVNDGDNLTLSVSATGTTPLAYQWLRNGTVITGATNSILSLTNVSLSNSGNYLAVVSNAAGSATSAVAVVTVLAVAPVITVQPVGLSIPDGSNATFSVTATGTAPLSYRWKHGSAAVTGGTNATLVLTNIVPGSAGNYVVVISNTAGAVTSVVAVLTVQNVGPTITQQPETQAVTDGTNVSFTVSVAGTRPMGYQWAFNGVNISNATDSVLSLTNVSFGSAGNYTVVASNISGVATSLVAVLTVLPLAPAIISQPVNRTVLDGTNVSFSVTAIGTSPIRYQWMRNGVGIAFKTNTTLTLTNVTLSSTGSYAVVISNIVGSITSSVATLTVQAIPPAFVTQPVGRTINDGDNVTFTVAVTGSAPLTYSWLRNGLAIGGATGASLTLTNAAVSASGNYSAVVTGPGGSLTSSVVVLTVLPVPPSIVSQPLSLTTNAGSEVIFAVIATGTPPLTYQWQRNGIALPGETSSALTFTNVQADDAGSYHVVVFNNEGFATGVEAALTVTLTPLAMTDEFSLEIGSTNFTGIGQASNTLATVEVDEPLHAGKRGGRSMWYAWQAPASGIATFSTAGSGFDTLLAVYQGDAVNNLVQVAEDDDSAGFYNSVVQFNVESNAVYHIAVDGAGDASGSIILQWALEVTTDVLPVITNQPVDRIVSLTSNAVFTVGVSGADVAYQWFFNGGAVPEGTNSTWTQAGVGLADVGQFTVQATIGTRTVTSRPASLGITLSPGLDQDFSAADKFSDTISSGRRLRLDPPPAASFARFPRNVAATSRGYSGSQVFSTVGSLKEPGEPDHCGVPGGASRWFAFEAETDGVLDLDTDGSTFDTILAIYTGTNANFSELTSVTCDNNSGTNGLTSSLHFTTVTGTIYYIAVDGVNGASGTVVLNYTTLGEQQRPSITITSAPPANVGLTNGSVTMSGIASDNTELLGVEWRVTNSLGSTEWTLATGSNSWTFTADDLAFGNNTVQIRSMDSWGNESAITSRTYLRLAPVTVTVDGCGSVTAGFLGTTYREPGRSFSIAATPCANSLFAGWSGDWVTNRNAVTLVTQTGLVLQANFVTNQFTGRVGSYAGLFYDTNTAAHESSGFVTARTTAKGTYSGKLRIGSKNHSFSGSFGIDGLATNSVRRGGTNVPFRLELNFNLNQLVQSLTGRVLDTGWSAELAAFRSVFNARTNPAPLQGRYTVLFAANGGPGTPEGDGYGAVTVSPNGSVRLSGALADGAPASQGTFVSREGLWPLYVPLRSGRGSIWSWLTFETNSVAFGTNVVQSNLAGDARWFVPALAAARFYPGGFTNALDVVGSRYIAPVSSTNGSLTFSNGMLVFDGGNLSTPFTNDVLRAVNDKVTDQGTNRLALSIIRSSGLFRGSVNVPEWGRAVSFKGVLFQNGDFGSGYFLHTNLGGSVWFGPRE